MVLCNSKGVKLNSKAIFRRSECWIKTITIITTWRCFGTPSSQVSPREQQWRNRMPRAQVLAEDAFWLFSSRIRAWTGIRWWRQVPWGRPPDGEVLTQQPLLPSGDRAPFGTARVPSQPCVCVFTEWLHVFFLFAIKCRIFEISPGLTDHTYWQAAAPPGSIETVWSPSVCRQACCSHFQRVPGYAVR